MSGERDTSAPLLQLSSVIAGYGRKRILNGVNLDVKSGEIVGIIGHNGAGKSTVLRTVFGLNACWEGSIALGGEPLNELGPHERHRRRIAYVPQGSRVFAELSVRENLEIGAITIRDRAERESRIERVLAQFPSLHERQRQPAGLMSGGERQSLALARALVLSPTLMLLDEPSLGLSPPAIRRAFASLRGLVQETGVAILMVEQKVRELLDLSDRVYVLRNGAVSYEGPCSELLDEERLREVYL